MKRFYVSIRKCPRRKVDAQRIFNYFEKNGWRFTARPSAADVMVVFTCGGFATHERNSLYPIRELSRKKHKSALIIITGCLLKIYPEKFKEFSDCRLLLPEQLDSLDEMIEAEVPLSTVPEANITRPLPNLFVKPSFRFSFIDHLPRYMVRKITGYELPVRGIFKQDVFNLLISRGCLGNCSYCSIRPYSIKFSLECTFC